MAKQKLNEVIKMLNKVMKRENEHKKDYFNYSTAFCISFPNKNVLIDQHQQFLELSDTIDSIKGEVEGLAKTVEKQDQYVYDLEQYRRSNWFILH